MTDHSPHGNEPAILDGVEEFTAEYVGNQDYHPCFHSVIVITILFSIEEHHRKIGEAHLGMKRSEKTKRRIGDAQRGKPKHSMEICKLVECTDVKGNLIHQFESIEAVTKQNFVRCCVSNCLAGRQRTHRGLYWRYSDA